MSDSRAPWLYRFVSDRCGQSETVGFALLVSLTILSVTVAVVLGSSAFSRTQEQSALQRAEHEMSVLDSRAATVALGETPVRSTQFGGSQGNYRIDPDAGHITVTHVNFDGGPDSDGNAVDDGNSDDDELIYESDLGALVYEVDGTEIAYQAGGVWRRGPQGGSTMIAPPEFHYRGATLTLPVITLDGSTPDGSTGRTTAVFESGPSRGIYPNETHNYGGNATRFYTNPAQEGYVVVEIESRYAHGWGSYFGTRTAGNVTYPGPDRVKLELVTAGKTGYFDMPSEGSGLEIRGLAGGHNLQQLDVTVRPDDADSASFSNLQWSFYVDEGSDQMEINLDQGSGHGCSMTGDLSLYYSSDNGATYESWTADDALTAQCADLNGDGNDEVYMELRLSGTTLMTNSDVGGNLVHYNTGGSTRDTTPTFNQHPGATLPHAGANETYTYADGDQEELGTLMSHYLALMGPSFELRVDDKNSNTVNEGASFGTIDYPPGGRYVTYLHISENHVNVTFT